MAYGQSKTANMLMAISLAEKLGSKGLVTSSLHPGVISTGLGAHLDWDADVGALRMCTVTANVLLHLSHIS